MSESKHDDALPPSIGEALKEIHEPPATPREAMWQQIQAQRQQSKIVRGRFTVPLALRIVAAAAAVLLAGFLLGRLWETRNPGSRGESPSVATSETADPASAPSQMALQDTPDSSTSVPRRDDPENSGMHFSQAQLVYAANHFNRSGVLLAQFAESADKEDPLDPALHQWARDLLTNTRLLLDSPLAEDPQYQKLLRELEFTLAQIVQASTVEETEERQWVAGQLSDRSLVERLRLVVPALPGSRDL
jgi:hypothetical protein